jgi:hypothetical protein
MRVRVTRVTDDNWYKVGEEYEVESKPVHRGGYDYYPLVEDKNVGIGPEHCEVIKEQLKFPFRVRCIDNMNAEEQLEEGKVYTAIGENVWNDACDFYLEGMKCSWSQHRFEIVEEEVEQQDDEYTGGSVSYYTVPVDKPTDPDKDPYIAECNDIIEALGMNYAEGNAFKAIWRSCAARKLGVAKKGYDDGLYDAQKVVFFGQRMVALANK